MRISDWSSDVCSSDLTRGDRHALGLKRLLPIALPYTQSDALVHLLDELVLDTTVEQDALVLEIAGERLADLGLGCGQETAAADDRNIDAGAGECLRKLRADIPAADDQPGPGQLLDRKST